MNGTASLYGLAALFCRRSESWKRANDRVTGAEPPRECTAAADHGRAHAPLLLLARLRPGLCSADAGQLQRSRHRAGAQPAQPGRDSGQQRRVDAATLYAGAHPAACCRSRRQPERVGPLCAGASRSQSDQQPRQRARHARLSQQAGWRRHRDSAPGRHSRHPGREPVGRQPRLVASACRPCRPAAPSTAGLPKPPRQACRFSASSTASRCACIHTPFGRTQHGLFARWLPAPSSRSGLQPTMVY